MTDPRILTLGLTGGIGSGKSYIAELLTARGIPVYDSDARAKALYDEDPVLRQALIEHFSPTLYKLMRSSILPCVGTSSTGVVNVSAEV